ncbi:MAG: hypothetical protein AB1781_11170 [Pseudomonadota bacterium]
MPVVAVKGWRRRILDAFGFDAMVVPSGRIWIKPECQDDIGLLVHEHVHLDQWARDGTVRFWWRTVWYYVTGRYNTSPYEIEAREAQRQVDATRCQQ